MLEDWFAKLAVYTTSYKEMRKFGWMLSGSQ